jgi:hypothetical protein
VPVTGSRCGPAALSILGDHPAAEMVWDAVSDLDLAIRHARSIVFDEQAADARSH